ncbi:MAG TPA: nuclease domain-containing protein, partial [Solirubrobacteraceae bacterium]
CRRVEISARAGRAPAASAVSSEAGAFVRRLERWRRHPTLSALPSSWQIPRSSTVMRGRAGYRHLAGFWGDLLGRTRLMDPATASRLMGLRDAAATYELWCYFAVVGCVEAALETQAVLEPYTEDDAAVNVPWRHVARIGEARVHYNRTFPSSKGLGRQPFSSYSVRLRPDICLELPTGEVHVFDAKLKRRVLTQQPAGEADGDQADPDVADAASFASGDLHKMHAYRDALGARSVWVLYPGTAGTHDAFPVHTGEAATAGGVGAIAVVPGASRQRLADTIGAIVKPHGG